MSDALRTALRELGDVPPPPDLAGAALARARRDRRRLAAVLTGVAVLAAAAIAVPTLALGRATTEPAAAESHVIVAGYGVVGARDAIGDPLVHTRVWNADKRRYETPPSPYRVYDRASGTYTLGPWKTTVPSPDGRLVAVSGDVDGGWKVGIVAADRVLDPAAVQWVADGGQGGSSLPTAYDEGVWSPDSSRLYLNSAAVWIGEGSQQRLNIRGYVVDARTGTTRELTYVRRQPLGSEPRLIFGPGGKGFAVVSNLDAGRGGELALLDEQGALVRTVRIPALEAPDLPFSPDGRLVALRTFDPTRGITQVLRLDTGAEAGRAPGPFVGWIDARHYAVRVQGAIEVIELSSGRVVAETQVLPAGRVLTGVWLARITGPVPAGAVVVA